MTTTPAVPSALAADLGRPSLREPAIDGLRALCVVAVVVYHLPAAWLPGGFLAVSSFFTLSGFLITRLLVRELRSTGRIRLGRFAVRRLRRLTPAALLIALTTVVAWAVTDRPLEPGDIPAAVLYVSNWWFLHIGQGYGQLFRVASPVQHYWSLAIEEQFYLVFPLVAWGLYKLVRGRLVWLSLALAVLTAAAFTASGLVDPGVAYYATPTRAGEILLGAVLALLLEPERINRMARRLAGGPIGWIMGATSLAGLLYLWASVDLQNPHLFPWVTLTNAAITATLILEVLYGKGVRRAFTIGAMTSLGRVSYGVYLVHWPVYLLVRPALDHELPVVRLLLVSVVSVVLATAAHHIVEEPVRTERRWRKAWFPAAVVTLASATMATAAVAVTRPPAPAFDESAVAAERARLLAPSDTPSAATTAVTTVPSTTVAPPTTARANESTEPTTTTTAPKGPLQRVLFIGDSTSWSLSLGVVDRMAPDGVEVSAFPAAGCGVGGPTIVKYLNQAAAVSETCQQWFEDLPTVLANFDPDVVLVTGGLADLSDRQLPDGTWGHIGEPAYDSWLADRIDELAEQLLATGTTLAWATHPHVAVEANPVFTGPPPFVENEPARADRYNELLYAAADRNPSIHLVDLAGYLQQRPGGEFAPGLREDGIHLDTRDAPDVADFLAVELSTAYAE